MGALQKKMPGCGLWGLILLAGAAMLGSGIGASAAAPRSRPAVANLWESAVRARAVLEAEPKSRHTRAEYARVIAAFRMVYYDNPADAHAARAAEQVAEVLTEEGHELDDRKVLREAAAQYAFVAKAYPTYKTPAYRAGRREDAVPPREESRPAGVGATAPAPVGSAYQRREVGHPAVAAAAVPVVPAEVATVTGIRHWSTGTYTRLAIDLETAGEGEVQYQAVRVQNPDRIFFDLHHVKLAPELAGKTFSVTDGGFLSNIRAAQLPGGSTRVVLDVHEVAEYSAFLLPNPERLIIDIHGRQEAGSRRQEAGQTDVAASSVPTESAPAPIVREAPPRINGTVEMSSLPPMPVTDGSAGFGLTPRSESSTPVAAPRVVIPTRPTPARPVPNTVARSSAETGSDVAAVSDQPGRVSATSKPTSLPVASGSRKQEAGSRTDVGDTGSGGDHYRSPRGAAADRRPASSSPVGVQTETTEGDKTLMRALGLKIGRIVIDAGHGGHDVGTLGAGGIQEKDVVLDVALRLGKLLHDRLGAEIVYTRADDTFIPLETRTAIANKAQADLFISVHANSSPDASARGVEVYYLNFTSDPDAMTVAGRENAVSTQSVHELSDLVKKIALKDKIDESRELAADVDASLYAGLAKGNAGLKDRGVKKAPFVVLIGANMPSILAEISFVTNPDDADQLQTPAYRERVAESLYKGVAKYAAGINGPTGPGKTAKTKTLVAERATR